MYYHLTGINIEKEDLQSNHSALEYERYVSYSEATRAESQIFDLALEMKYRHIFLSII